MYKRLFSLLLPIVMTLAVNAQQDYSILKPPLDEQNFPYVVDKGWATIGSIKAVPPMILGGRLITSQEYKTEILVGEYANYILENGNAYTFDAGVKVQYALPEKVTTGFAGHPWANVIGESGQVYGLLGDSKTLKKVSITNAASSSAYYTHQVIVGRDGSIKVYADADGKVVSLKTNAPIKKVVAAAVILALDVNGNVWSYNWIKTGKIVKTNAELESLTPVRINLPGQATAIATSRSLFSGAIVSGDPYVWCESYGAQFVGLTKATPTPVNMKATWGITERIDTIVMSDNTTHMLTASGKLLGLGNAWVGEVGDGQKDPRVLKGTADMGYKLFVKKAAQIGSDRVYKRIFKGTYYAFRNFAEETNGIISSWGYGKFGLLLNGIFAQDDPAYVGVVSVDRPRRIQIPTVLVRKTTTEAKVMVGNGTYPPAEYVKPRKLLSTECKKIYDDGTLEVELINQ